MADTHLQLNADGTLSDRKTVLWPSSKDLQQQIIKKIFEQKNWHVHSVDNVSGSHWKIVSSCCDYSWKINLYISSIRDESRQPDEFKMQLGNSYPNGIEDGWIDIILGIYTINDGVNPEEYILSGYDIVRYDFSTNPSIRGTRTVGLQKALIFGMYATDKSILFRPEFLYHYIQSQSNKRLNETDFETKKLINTEILNNPILTALRTKPFLLLAGISGTGKSRIVRELAFKSCPEKLQDKDRTTPGNYCMIEVKPNWHDSSELLGYYSNISKKYVYTKFVKFLVKAMRFPDVPFFVCLDEMNLAPVEQYFAEFLSVLETRKMVGDTVVTGPLVDKSFFSEIYETNNNDPTDNEWYEYFSGIKKEVEIPPMTTSEDSPKYGPQSLKEKGLCLPENVFVIGTVNMDDTTHQFSRKVIDRAMTIEMNGGKLEDMFGGSKNLEYLNDPEIFTMDHIGAKYVSADDALEYCERMNNDEVRKFVTGKDDDGNIITDGETLPKMLYKINDILKNTPFQVSYRVLNELVIYLAVLLDEDKDGKPIEDLAKTALDNIMLMKILPRIEGDSEMFNQNGEDNKLVELQKMFAPEYKSYKKLDEMIKRLESTEFTRFWP